MMPRKIAASDWNRIPIVDFLATDFNELPGSQEDNLNESFFKKVQISEVPNTTLHCFIY
jgi:hypothetical protein